MYIFSLSGLVAGSTTSTLIVFTTILLLVRAWMPERLFFRKRRSALPAPPGPRCLPLLGYLQSMGSSCHLQLTELGKKYGKVFQIYLGSSRVVVVSDPALVRQAFKQQVFSGRPDTGLTELLGGYGIINAEGPLWTEQRQFLHTILRDFGAKNTGPNTASLENNIQVQVSDLLSTVESAGGSPFLLRPWVARAVSNVIGSLLMGVTFDDNAGFRRLMTLIEEGFSLLTLGVPVNFIPKLKHFPFLCRAYNKIESNKRETHAYFKEVADSHRDTLDEGHVRDFVDAFFVEQERTKRIGKTNYFSDLQLHQVMGDVFSAGLETVTSTLEWAVVYLLRNPRVASRVQAEIDQVVGRERRPELGDMPDMPYTEATILEIQRRANVIALGTAHATLADTELGGFHISKDTHVIPNLWAIHMDPTLWDCPEEFRPERFLVEGKVVKPSYFMPFSVGRRMCIGDSLAKMEVFLFLSSLLQKFDLRVPEGDDLPSLEGTSTVSLTAKPFKLCAFPRQDE